MSLAVLLLQSCLEHFRKIQGLNDLLNTADHQTHHKRHRSIQRLLVIALRQILQEFCQVNYGVDFLITEKVDVKGSEQHPLYEWLTNKAENGKKSSVVRWNFQKYLVDEEGGLIDYYYSITKPTSRKITKHLNS